MVKVAEDTNHNAGTNPCYSLNETANCRGGGKGTIYKAVGDERASPWSKLRY